MEHTRQNVEWQLKRIYRVRNTIVHKGRSMLLLPQLLQHLHSYLVKTIRSVLAELDRQPTWSLRDALEHRRNLFEHMIQVFKQNLEPSVSVKSILNPASCMEPQRAPYGWPPAPQPAPKVKPDTGG